MQSYNGEIGKNCDNVQKQKIILTLKPRKYAVFFELGYIKIGRDTNATTYEPRKIILRLTQMSCLCYCLKLLR